MNKLLKQLTLLSGLFSVSLPAARGTEIVHVEFDGGAIIVADKRELSVIRGKNDKATKIRAFGKDGVMTIVGNLELMDAETKTVIFDPANLLPTFLKGYPAFDGSKESDRDKLYKFAEQRFQSAINVTGTQAIKIWPNDRVANNFSYCRYRPETKGVELLFLDLSVDHSHRFPKALVRIGYCPNHLKTIVAGSNTGNLEKEYNNAVKANGNRLLGKKMAIKLGVTEVLKTHKLLTSRGIQEVGNTCDIFVLDKNGLSRFGKPGGKLIEILKQL